MNYKELIKSTLCEPYVTICPVSNGYSKERWMIVFWPHRIHRHLRIQAICKSVHVHRNFEHVESFYGVLTFLQWPSYGTVLQFFGKGLITISIEIKTWTLRLTISGWSFEPQRPLGEAAELQEGSWDLCRVAELSGYRFLPTESFSSHSATEPLGKNKNYRAATFLRISDTILSSLSSTPTWASVSVRSCVKRINTFETHLRLWGRSKAYMKSRKSKLSYDAQSECS